MKLNGKQQNLLAYSNTEKLRVCACANEIDPILIHLVDQQKISADMAFAVVRPFPFECMV